MRTTLKQKDSYINKLESAKDSQDRELSYLLATNNDLADQNKVISHIIYIARSRWSIEIAMLLLKHPLACVMLLSEGYDITLIRC